MANRAESFKDMTVLPEASQDLWDSIGAFLDKRKAEEEARRNALGAQLLREFNRQPTGIRKSSKTKQK
jgi:hypothetical protein